MTEANAVSSEAGGVTEACRVKLARVRALLVDLEGTVRFGGTPIPGAAEALNRLRAAGYSLCFTTNIDSMTAKDICRGLTDIGVQADPAEIFTPVAALRHFMARNPERSWLFLLSKDVQSGFAALQGAAQAADFVVVGDFRDEFSYERINSAYRQLMNGARLVALQPQPFFMGPDGYYLDTGAIVHMLEWASGKTAIVLGKPSPDYYLTALEGLGLRPGEALAIGDDVGTDIKGAAAAGCPSVLVRTGKFDAGKVAASAAQPDVIVNSLAEVPEVLAACRM
ncbi:MAG: HAD-IIA family hydrolase [Gaiellales bacterium]|nr:HAD-IIA family hydrolase [Gaiellales bacterium]